MRPSDAVDEASLDAFARILRNDAILARCPPRPSYLRQVLAKAVSKATDAGYTDDALCEELAQAVVRDDDNEDAASHVALGSVVMRTVDRANEVGLRLWPAAEVLVEWALDALTPSRVLELGAGLGLVGLALARRQQGRKMYQGQSSHLPLKVNMAGVIPAIFASSLLLFPASLGQWFGQSEGMEWIQDVSLWIAPGQPLNIILFSIGIIFFCFWYTSIMFNPKEVADNLKRSGAFIPGYRPGDQTARYIDTIITRLTLFGSLYMTLVCLLPQFLVIQFNITFQLGGTALLIVVVVIMDFMAQVQTHLMSHQYESLMKKSNLQNFGRR